VFSKREHHVTAFLLSKAGKDPELGSVFRLSNAEELQVPFRNIRWPIPTGTPDALLGGVRRGLRGPPSVRRAPLAVSRAAKGLHHYLERCSPVEKKKKKKTKHKPALLAIWRAIAVFFCTSEGRVALALSPTWACPQVRIRFALPKPFTRRQWLRNDGPRSGVRRQGRRDSLAAILAVM